MKKKLLIFLSAILACAMMLTACGSEKAPETTAATVAATVAPVPAETAAPSQPLSLTTWNMTASTWSSPNGATIHITATPNYYLEGQQADFVVRMADNDVAKVPCQWDGSSYTASADLNAANGYSYYVILTAADGTVAEVPVNTPEVLTNEAFIDIETALESFCSIIVEESSFENGQLTLTGGKVQIQLPLITNDGETITCQEAVLLLSLNGEEVDRKVLTLTEADSTGLYEVTLDNTVLTFRKWKSIRRPTLPSVQP